MSGNHLPSTGPDRRRGDPPAAGRSAARRRQRHATDVQRALLPSPVFSNDRVEVAAVNRPRWAIGGDFYDYVDTGREFRVVVGDACGKGTAAALQAAVVQGLLAIEVEQDGRPAEVMAHLNQALCRRTIPARFVTLFYAVLTPDHRLTYCNAGLCRPLLVNRHRVWRLAAGGPPLGIWGTARFQEATLDLHDRDVLVACSDGILEAMGGNGNGPEEFGDGRVLEAVWKRRGRSAREIVEGLVATVQRFTGGARPQDDVTAVVVRYRAQNP
jgi:sigma-B regulation protein RsbU (phosphoserine phosphatase)